MMRVALPISHYTDVRGDGSRVAVDLACSGGVCAAVATLDFVPDPAGLGSIVIHDNAVAGVDTAPKFLCATLTHPDLDVEFRLPDTESGTGAAGGKGTGKGMAIGTMGTKKGEKGEKGDKGVRGSKRGQGLIAAAPTGAAAGADHATRLLVVMICAIAAGFGLAARRMRGATHGEGLRSPRRTDDLGVRWF